MSVSSSSMDRNNDSSRGSPTNPVRPSNPYAVKRATPDLFRTPLAELDGFVGEDEPLPMTTVTTPNQHEATKTNDTTTVVAFNTTKAASLDHESISEKEDKTNMIGIEKDPTTVASMPMSVSLPLWKRLPSNTISFGPAEILTVSEVCQSGYLYESKSIRTTGVLRHRFCHPMSGDVSLLLEDPLAKLSMGTAGIGQTTTQKSCLKGNRRISFGKNTTNTAMRRPSLGMANSRTTPLISRTATTPGSSSIVKTPGMSKLVPTTPARLPSGSFQFRTPRGLSSRKRPLSSKRTKTTPKRSVEETLATLLMDHSEQDSSHHPSTFLWVVADPNYVSVETLAVGDLATVIGTVQLLFGKELESQSENNSSSNKEEDNIHASSSSMPTTAGSTSAVARQVGSIVLKHHQQVIKNTTPLSTKTNDGQNHKALYVQARVLRQDNGANLRLHWEALKLRRKHLLETYYPDVPSREEGKDGMDEGKMPTVLLGCGPPPYNHSTTESNND